MAEPLKFLTERAAAKAAIAMIERGERAEALKLLRRVTKRRKAPKRGEDERAIDIVELRGHFEKAIDELVTGATGYAVNTLRHAIERSDAKRD